MNNDKLMPPVHPGEILKEDFMIDYNLKSTELARRMGVPRSRIEAIIRCERAITIDTAIRLSKIFKWSAQTWVNIQNKYDTEIAMREHGDEYKKLKRIKIDA